MKKISRLFLKFTTYLIVSCLFLTLIPQYAFAFTETLDEEIDELISEHEDTTAGLATIVIEDDEIIINRMVGYADIERDIKVDEDTVFEWGSSSKLLIWISVMQLVEDGLIDLDRDIRENLPQDFKTSMAYDEPITMLHLMNHSAGFDDSYTDLMLHDPVDVMTLRQALEGADIRQVFRPGDVVAYSNYGSALAAYIVEMVSGMDYREYVKKNIFGPLGMEYTSIAPQQEDNLWVKAQRDEIQGYTTDKKLIDPNQYVIPIYPAGSVVGTADDFALFLTALLSDYGHPLFKSRETIDKLFEPTLYFPGTDIPRIVHGFFALPARNRVYGHGGNTMAFSSSMYFDRESRLGVLVMTNQAHEEYFCLGIPEVVFGRPEFSISDESLEDSSMWTGIYQPARMPYHGFTKIYGLLNRVSVKHQGEYDLLSNKIPYTQQSPGMYMTKEGFGIYSRDVYSRHPRFKKLLSYMFSDAIHIPLWRHLFEVCLVVAGVVAILFSLIYISIRAIQRIQRLKRSREKRDVFILIQNMLNLILVLNLVWMIKSALSMVAYDSLKMNFTLNILYLVLTIALSVYSLFKRKCFKITTVSSLILCANLLYWQFYY